jgi:GTP-binding protein HflX
VLQELDCADKPTLLVLNKTDQVPDLSILQVLQAHHPRSVAISAAKRAGLDQLQDAVIEMLSADFARAVVETDAGNGKVLSYLSAHAEIYRQEFHDSRVLVECSLPRHLFHHIQGPGVTVRFEDGEKGQRQGPVRA